jgi:hypothetical protein
MYYTLLALIWPADKKIEEVKRNLRNAGQTYNKKSAMILSS